MSFDEFAKRIAGTPEAAAGAAARAAELARKPFAEAFVSEVYPHWQGPLKSISGKQGVESVTHSHVAGHLPVPEVRGAGPTLLTEILTVASHVGVRAVVAYAFSGDVNDGAVMRLAGYIEADGMQLVSNPGPVTFARGPLAKLIEDLVEDVPIASDLFGLLLVAGLEARQDRLAREEAAREAEEKRAAEEAAARKQAEADEVERQKTAALAESKRLEREAEEKRQAEAEEPVPAPSPEPAPEPEPEE